MQKNLEAVGGRGSARRTGVRASTAEGVGPRRVGHRHLGPGARRGVEPAEGGSTDVADVSHITPTSAWSRDAGATCPASWRRPLPRHPGASKAAETAARVIALTGVDLLTHPRSFAQARADFVKRTEETLRLPDPGRSEAADPEVTGLPPSGPRSRRLHRLCFSNQASSRAAAGAGVTAASIRGTRPASARAASPSSAS